MKPKLLDLFCGAGGCSVGYARAGFEVVGVDVNPQPRYPFGFHHGDALEFLATHADRYDVIHASPPCQAYLNLGAVNRALGRDYDHADLVEVTRDLLVSTGKPWIIENVAGSPLVNPFRLCGTGFGLPIRRHRIFESSHYVFSVACSHESYTEPRYWTSWRPNGEHRLARTVQVYGNAGGREHWPVAMGIDWMTPAEMTEAIPPAYTEHIGAQLLPQIEVAV